MSCESFSSSIAFKSKLTVAKSFYSVESCTKYIYEQILLYSINDSTLHFIRDKCVKGLIKYVKLRAFTTSYCPKEPETDIFVQPTTKTFSIW